MGRFAPGFTCLITLLGVACGSPSEPSHLTGPVIILPPPPPLGPPYDASVLVGVWSGTLAQAAPTNEEIARAIVTIDSGTSGSVALVTGSVTITTASGASSTALFEGRPPASRRDLLSCC